MLVEADAEIGIEPDHVRPLELAQEEAQVLLDHIEIQRLIGDSGVNAKAAGVRTPNAAEHGDDLDQGGFSVSVFDELPAFGHAGNRQRLLSGFEMQADGPVRRAVLQDVADQRLVGETQDIIEILLCVLRIAARVRAAQNGDRALGAQTVAQSIGERR